jgi:hypothetical protein
VAVYGVRAVGNSAEPDGGAGPSLIVTAGS